MPIETLPGAAHLGWLVGMQWPEGDEDSMWALAQDWRNAANSLAGIDSDIDAAISAVRAAYPDGSGGEAMIEQLQAMRKGPQSIDELVTWINTIADSAEQTGNSIESAKIQFNVMLGVLAIETAIAAASLLAGPEEEAIAIAAGRVTARAIIEQLLEDLTVQGLKNAALALLKNIFKKFMLHLALNLAMTGGVDLGTQGWQMLNGHRSSIDWKEVGEVTASGLAGALVGGLAGGLAGKLGAGSLLKSLIGGEAGMLGGWAANGLMTHNWQFDPRMLTAGAFQSVVHHAGEGNSPAAKGFSEPEVRPDELSLPETNDGSVPRSEPVDTTSSDQPPVSANPDDVVNAGDDHPNINADNTVHSGYSGPGDGEHGFNGENPSAATHPAGYEHTAYDDVAGQDHSYHSHDFGSTGGVADSAALGAGVYSSEGSTLSGGDRAGADNLARPEPPISARSAGAGESTRTPVASARPQTTGDGSSSFRPAQSETPSAQSESPLTPAGFELSGTSDLPSADYAPTDKPFNPLFDQPVSDDPLAGDFPDAGPEPVVDTEFTVPDDISGIDTTPAPPEPPIRAGLAESSQHPADPSRPPSRPGTPRELSSPIRARGTGAEPGTRAGDPGRTSDRAGSSEQADHPYEFAGAVARGDDGSPSVAEHALRDNDSPPPGHPGKNLYPSPPEDARGGEDGTRHTPDDGTGPRELADPHSLDQGHPGAHHDSTDHTPEDLSTPAAEHAHPEPPSIEDAFANHAEPTEAGLSLHGGDDHVGDLPHRVPADDRYFTVDAHITEDGYVRIGGHEYTPEEFGRMFPENGWDGEKPIRLIGCDAAENGFADRLAANLGTDVLAPTDKAWTDEHGRVYSSSAGDIGPDGNRRPRIPPDGEWQTSHPDGTKTHTGEDGFVPGTPEADKHGANPDHAHERGEPDGPYADLSDMEKMKLQVVWANNEPEYFREFYKDYGNRADRKSITAVDDTGQVPPHLLRDPSSREWIPAKDEPPALQPKTPLQVDPVADRDTATEPALEEIDKGYDARDKAIADDVAAHRTLKSLRNALQADDTPENKQAVADYQKIHAPLHREMTDAAENFGETIAREHAIPNNYPGAEPVELFGPGNGNDQFDQMYRWTDENGTHKLIVVECKSTVDTPINGRHLPDGKAVMQGTREYFLDIMREMYKRGETNEAELLTALDLDQALREGRVEYIMVQGVVDGSQYVGYVRKILDIRE